MEEKELYQVPALEELDSSLICPVTADTSAAIPDEDDPAEGA